jgi:predicted HNH restriction endonuclease
MNVTTISIYIVIGDRGASIPPLVDGLDEEWMRPNPVTVGTNDPDYKGQPRWKAIHAWVSNKDTVKSTYTFDIYELKRAVNESRVIPARITWVPLSKCHNNEKYMGVAYYSPKTMNKSNQPRYVAIPKSVWSAGEGSIESPIQYILKKEATIIDIQTMTIKEWSEVLNKYSRSRNIAENTYFKGNKISGYNTHIERNSKARNMFLLKLEKWACQVCTFDFHVEYGEIGEDYIHVHHNDPLGNRAGIGRAVNIETDFTAICPNCHYMIHSKNPPSTVEELQKIRNDAKNQQK